MPAQPSRPVRLQPAQKRRQRSTFARAVTPVAGGLAAIGLILGFTWLLAAYISGGGSTPSELLAPTRLPLGSAQNAANSVANDGPILIQDLGTTDGDRAIVVDHDGGDSAQGWRVFYAFPEGRPDCPIEQVPETARFIDCDGTEIGVEALSPPLEPIRPVVEGGQTLYIDLSAFLDIEPTATTITPDDG